MKTTALIAWAAVLFIGGCDSWPTKPDAPRIVTDVRTIPAAPTVIPVPCATEAGDVPEPFVSSIPYPADLKRWAAGADADLSWIVPRYAKARAKLIECSQLPKEDTKP